MSKKNDMFVQRLEVLKQATILNYLDEINFDNIMELYDVMIEHLLQGDFDDVFLSKYLIGLDEEEKAEIFQLARRFKPLCFYMGDAAYWTDSIEGVYLSDLDFVSMKLLDNFDFLLGISKEGGDAALKQLMAFQGGHMSVSGSVIDCLRNSFGNDDILKDIILEMSTRGGNYSGLKDFQKEILCTYPDGILFHHVGDEYKIIPPQEIIEKIQIEYFGSPIEDYKDFSSLGALLNDTESFENVIISIYYGGDKDTHKKK